MTFTAIISVALSWLLIHTLFTLRHALSSYLFGSVILATTINLVAEISSGGL